MSYKKITDFQSASINDSSLGVLGDPNSSILYKTGFKAMKDYFTAGISGSGNIIDTGSFVSTSSFNTFSSSVDSFRISSGIQVLNVFASESNYLPTSSFTLFSGSYVTDSGSFNSRVNSVSGSFNNFSSSYVLDSASSNTRITNISGSLISTSSFNSYTSSVNLQITNTFASESNYVLTSSFNSYSSSINIQFGNILISESKFLQTSSYLIDSSSFLGKIGNVFASESNYLSTSSFNTYTASTNSQILNVYASESNNLSTASYFTDSSSFLGRISNVLSSESNYTPTSSFNNYTASTSIQIANIFSSESNYTPTSSFNSFSSSYSTDSSSYLNKINNVFSSESNYLPTSSLHGSLVLSGSTNSYYKPFIPSTTITSFGDSITFGQNATGLNGYIQLLSTYYGQTLNNQAVSGRGVWQMANNAFANLTSNSTFVTAMAGFNDYRRSGTNSKTDNKLIGCYNSLLVQQWASSFVTALDSAVTWSAAHTSYNSGVVGGKSALSGGYFSTTSSIQSASYNFTGSNIAVGLIGNSGDIETFGTAKIYIDGALQSTINTNTLYDNISDSNYDNRRGPYTITYLGLSTGSHKIQVQSQGDGYVILDYFATLNNTSSCKPVLFYEIPYMDATGYATIPSTASNAIFDSGSLLIKNIVTQYSSSGFPILYVPTNTYYVATTASGLSATDHIHPSDTGHLQIESGSVNSINNVSNSIYIPANLINFGNNYFPGAIYDYNASSGSSGQVLVSTVNGIKWSNSAGGGSGGTISGSGVTGYISVFSGSSALSSSTIYQTGGNLGIGTTTPQSVLNIGVGNNNKQLLINSISPNANSVVEIYGAGGISIPLRLVSDGNGRIAVFHASTNASTNTGYGIQFSTQQGTNVINNISSFSNVNSGTPASLQIGATNIGLGTVSTPTAIVHIQASTAGTASMRINSGSAPTTPKDGDIWYDIVDSSLKMNLGGTIATFLSTASFNSFTSSINSQIQNVFASESNYAPLASPSLTGVPTVPTAVQGTNTSQAASTAFVLTSSLTNDAYLSMQAAAGGTLKAETAGITLSNVNSSLALATGVLRFVGVYVKQSQTITGVKFVNSVAGAYTASNSNGAALYSWSAGNLTLMSQSANTGSIWANVVGNSLGSIPLTSSVNVTPGLYFVGVLYNGTGQITAPSIGTAAQYNTVAVSYGDLPNSTCINGFLTSQATFPVTQSFAGISPSTSNIWIGLY